MFRKHISALVVLLLFGSGPPWSVHSNGTVITSAREQGQDAASDRIARVENGLLPRAVPQGQAGKPMSIAARMAYHGVPGMSMAVIEDGVLRGRELTACVTGLESCRLIPRRSFKRHR